MQKFNPRQTISFKNQMPELRKDPIVGRWVIIATERQRRPGNFVDADDNTFQGGEDCPFCRDEDPAVIAIGEKGTECSGRDPWKVKVVSSGSPIVRQDVKWERKGQGLYDVMNGYGVHEVVIETPEHIANMADLDAQQIKLVFHAYAARMKALEEDPRLQYVLAYKNYGWVAGSRRIGHSRSQIVGTPVNPLRVKEKLNGAKKYFDYHDRCIYCDLIHQEQEQKKRVVLESEAFIAVTPFAARFLFELLVIPKKHDCDFAQGILGREDDLAGFLKELLLRIKTGLNDPAYNFVIQTSPFRREKDKKTKWKTIEDDYHWHIEIMPRLTRIAGFEKGTGFYICSIPPEDTAEYLRGVKI